MSQIHLGYGTFTTLFKYIYEEKVQDLTYEPWFWPIHYATGMLKVLHKALLRAISKHQGCDVIELLLSL